MNPEERTFILDKARAMLDNATGARFCECVKHLGPASGFRTERDPGCRKCGPGGMISNPGWKGTREHFDALLPRVKQCRQQGTAYVYPRDAVGPGGKSSMYWTSDKGIRLVRGWRALEVEDGTHHKSNVAMTWNQIFDGLTAAEQMTLEMSQ